MAIAAGERLLVLVRKQDKEVLGLHYILFVLSYRGVGITHRFVVNTGSHYPIFCAACGQAGSLCAIPANGYLKEGHHGQTGCCHRRKRKSRSADCV
jgi:hypothetical protein